MLLAAPQALHPCGAPQAKLACVAAYALHGNLREAGQADRERDAVLLRLIRCYFVKAPACMQSSCMIRLIKLTAGSDLRRRPLLRC